MQALFAKNYELDRLLGQKIDVGILPRRIFGITRSYGSNPRNHWRRASNLGFNIFNCFTKPSLSFGETSTLS